jgi:orotidine-5'-phosphate decarboxylase
MAHMTQTRPIVALDVPSLDAMRAMVERLGPSCDFYKVGLELFAAEGPRAVAWLRDAGKDVFVDLKAHDIPNTVEGVARSVARLGARLLTVHAVGGSAMLKAAVAGAGGETAPGSPGCGILAVTVLTSFSADGLAEAYGRPGVAMQDEVLRLAGLAAGAGCHGIVCSGHEVAAVASALPQLRPLVPGVRLPGTSAHDQARVVTPGEAQRGGAAYVVLGRTVTGAEDPRGAMNQARSELGLAPA